MQETNERSPGETAPIITVQIIAAALIVGPLAFAAIAYVTTLGRPPGDVLIPYLAVGLAILAIFASLIGPGLVANQQLGLPAAKPDVSTMDLLGVYQTRIIIRAAILEAAALFCCVAFLISRIWWTLGTAFGLIVLMAVLFPTQGRFDNWAREQRELRSLNRQ